MEPPSPAHGASNGPVVVGEPEAPKRQWCKHCQADVPVEGRGMCSRCGRFLRLNYVNRKHPVNMLRRDALKAEIVAEFRPSNVLERSTCEHLAATLERLENTRAGTPEYQRLVQLSQQLGESLSATRAEAPRIATDYHAMTDGQLISCVEDLLKDLYTRRNDTRTLAEALVMTTDPPVPTRVANDDLIERPSDDPRSVTTDSPAPVRKPMCGYGCGSFERCAEIKATRPDVWQTLHYADPEEIARRDQEATRVMLARGGKGSPCR